MSARSRSRQAERRAAARRFRALPGGAAPSPPQLSPSRPSTRSACTRPAAPPGRRSPSALRPPCAQVGTLDSLMALSDDLVRIDSAAETTAFKILKQLNDLDVSR